MKFRHVETIFVVFVQEHIFYYIYILKFIYVSQAMSVGVKLILLYYNISTRSSRAVLGTFLVYWDILRMSLGRPLEVCAD